MAKRKSTALLDKPHVPTQEGAGHKRSRRDPQSSFHTSQETDVTAAILEQCHPAEDVSYIAEGLRHLAVRIDSLGMDPMNVKDHGELDLPTHQASLREFGIRRAVVVRRENRQIEAGNGTVLASLRNGWQYVPVLWVDDDQKRARAFALADNAVSTLAAWNEENLETLLAESPDLFSEADLQGMADQVMRELHVLEETSAAEPAADVEQGPAKESDMTVSLSRRVIVVCDTEPKQIELLKELSDRGFECRLSTVRVV